MIRVLIAAEQLPTGCRSQGAEPKRDTERRIDGIARVQHHLAAAINRQCTLPRGPWFRLSQLEAGSLDPCQAKTDMPSIEIELGSECPAVTCRP